MKRIQLKMKILQFLLILKGDKLFYEIIFIYNLDKVF